MDLTVLNEKQLQEFVRIVAEDFKFKYETLQQLHAKVIKLIIINQLYFISKFNHSFNQTTDNVKSVEKYKRTKNIGN